jgi:beta-lactamase regulating signal transducer with metallopeptidase domain/peptidoglycan/xylan/chitin deacetylase (PgdA/CDA1 family)
MNLLVMLERQPVWQALGLTLLHFLWQGLLMALLLAFALHALKRADANLRYAAATAAMLLMLVVPLLTFGWLNHAYRINAKNDSQTQATRVANIHQGQTLEAAEADVEAFDQFAGDDAAWVGAISWQRWSDRDLGFVPVGAAVLWLTGAMVFSLRLAFGWNVVRSLSASETRALPDAWQAALLNLSQRLGVKRVVRLCESVRIEVPTVIGFLKPVILVPASALVGLSAPQLESLLAHELAHIRRHDFLFNLLQSIVETLLFFHPAVWWASRRMRVEREHCSDDLAVWACGDVLTYANALADLETLRGTSFGHIALAANGGSLLRRIRRLVELPAQQPARFSSLIASLIFFGALLFGAALSAQTAVVSRQLEARGATALKLRDVGRNRKVAVSFVSLPTYRGINEPLSTTEAATRKLIQSIYAQHVPAIGFVGERRLGHNAEEITARTNILRMWLDAGLELGNETYSHPYLYKMPPNYFEADVVRGEKITRALLKERGQELKYFSYPYLNTGPDLQTKAQMEKFLTERGYTIAPVTIDNMDWLFAKVYNEAREHGDVETMRRVSDEYVPYMERMFEFYEKLSTDVVGYELPQILLLTTSQLNADKFDELAEMIKRRGYTFVSLDEALQDKAYSQPDNYVGRVGCSWLQRWAITRGGEFRKEPYLPQFMQQFDPIKDSASDYKTNGQ